MIYLDYAATTPMTEQAISAYTEAAKQLSGNTSSLHDIGGRAAMALDWARETIANKLNVSKQGIIFTGSGTESNLIGILALARTQERGNHIITSMAEHTSVHAAMNTLEREGFIVTKLPLNEQGVIDVTLLEQAIQPNTTLISIQHVNSEIGTIQPVEEIAQIAQKYGISYHVDCVQSYCKLPIKSFSEQVDAISLSAHKIGGPKGCGAVYINPQKRWTPLYPGVTHEKGLRGGTVDTPSVIAMAIASEQFTYKMDYFWSLRQRLKQQLTQLRWVEGESQLPNICGLCLPGSEGQYVMLRCNEKQIGISTGSACDLNSASGTKAILAMGKSLEEARQFFRVSFGGETTIEEIQSLIHVIECI